MDALVILSILLLGGLAMAAVSKPRGTEGMNDTPVSIENVRKGVERGWYKAVLVRVDGAPGIYLYGLAESGKKYGDTFPISEADWQTLKAEGYAVQ